MNLLDIYKELNTEEKCLAFLEHMRWPDGVKCISCESLRITRITAKGKKNRKTGKRSPDRELYQCNECRFQFTATTGTVYHDTHLPLSKWFLAIALITESKKGISANQLARALGVQYRTAWHLAHRIRKAMVEANPPQLTGVVEMDETYIGGKQRGYKGKNKNKEVVMGIRERGGDLRLIHIENNSSAELGAQIKAHVSPKVKQVMTRIHRVSGGHDLRWHSRLQARNNQAQRENLRAWQRPHEHRGIGLLIVQAWPNRSLPQSFLKAPATLLE